MYDDERYVEETKVLRVIVAEYTDEEFEDYKARLMDKLEGNNLNTALELAAKFRGGKS